MNCDRVRPMLFLYRFGELSQPQTKEVLAHLRACERCRLEKDRIDSTETIIQRVRSYTPEVDNPDHLTSTIVSKVRQLHSVARRAGIIDGLLDLFVLPRVRIVSATFVVLAIGTFLVQYFSFFADIHGMELSSERRNRTSSTSEVTYAVETKRLQELTHSSDIQSLIPPGQYWVNDGQILVHESDVTSFLSSYALQSLTSTVASSVLHVDKKKLDKIIEGVVKEAKTITTFGR